MALKKLTKAFKDWRSEILAPALQKVPYRQSAFTTTSGTEVPELDIPSAAYLSEQHYLEQLGFPGQFPFTRGVQPSMYRARLWSMRQYAGFGTAQEANERYRYLLSQGTSGLSVAFDLPTQMGRDSDHPLAAGEVGRVGVAIDHVEDMEELFQDIPLDTVSTSMTINATAFILLAFYLAVAQRRGIDWKSLRGTIQNDILKEYIARGTYIYPPEPAMKIVTDIFEFCKDEVPGWNTISVSGYHIREAGSTAAQEIAFTLADGIAYVEAAIERGMQVDQFAPRVAFFFNCHNSFLEEIAKFRAARRMWARIMKERFQAKDPRSMMLRFHTQTAGSTLTAQQPLNNAVRTTIQALAAVLGGTQSLHTNGFDEALCLPTERSALLALRTQQVIAEESGVADVVDPLGGSYTIERLTDSLEEQALALIADIDAAGGMIAAIDGGIPQKHIEEAAYQYQRALESGDANCVGVTVHADGEGLESGEGEIELLKVDPLLEKRQIERLQCFKAERDAGAATTALRQLEQHVGAGQNIMPAVIEAVSKKVTLGEISDLLRDRWGEYQG